MPAVVDSSREFFIKGQIRSLLLRHIVNFDCPEAPRDGVCGSHEADTVLALVGLERFHQFFFLFLEDAAERTRHLINLADGRPNLLKVTLLQVERDN